MAFTLHDYCFETLVQFLFLKRYLYQLNLSIITRFSALGLSLLLKRRWK